MAGAVIENLSNQKLSYILGLLFLVQIAFFLVGAWLAPKPTSSMEFLFRSCIDANVTGRNWVDHQNCHEIELAEHKPLSYDLREIVFMTQMPHKRDNQQLRYHPSFQFLLGVMQPEIRSTAAFKHVRGSKLRLEVRMGARGGGDEKWRDWIEADVVRELDCHFPWGHESGDMHCDALDFFEIGYVPFPFYVMNIRIPIDREGCARDPKNTANCDLGELVGLNMVVIHQNGGFTMVWAWMKTIVVPFLFLTVRWYWDRVQSLARPPLLLEKAIFALGVSTTVLDLPIEWLPLWFERVPFMLLLGDLRQGLFYAVLCSFWLIFAGEHLIDDPTRNNLKSYWRNLSLVGTAGVALLVYDMCERGMQLSDPFYSIWSSSTGTKLAYLSIYLATLFTVIYFSFLFYKIWMVWKLIKQKRSNQYYQNNESRRLKVEAIIFRFKFLMLFTLLCAFLTILSYAMKQHGEAQLHDDEPQESLLTNSTSAFFTGTFGMWNIYVFLLLSMYAPSHKQYVGAQHLMDETEELMDGSAESNPMTTFLKPSSD
ncbi:unnamed protein product, partial [Mesorhabditis belari]|uniref:Protein wntless n=1 Tax=Mesorhabditis belari TaxID=2138241 RepID=A0AAF3ETT5_9BILA